jgi:hypothetical protein
VYVVCAPDVAEECISMIKRQFKKSVRKKDKVVFSPFPVSVQVVEVGRKKKKGKS